MQKAMRMLAFSMLLVLTMFASLSISYAADITGNVQGTIKSTAGAPLSGVEVVLSPGGQSAVTNKDGYYVITGIPSGTYTITTNLVTFDTSTATVSVVQDQTSTNDFVMKKSAAVSTGTSTITFTGVRRTQTVPAYTIGASTEQKTKSQPNNLYQFPGLVFGQPGVTPDPSGYTHIRGSDFNQVGFDVDGVQVTEPMTNSFATNLVTVGLKSANLYTGAADASYGGASGGYINEVTYNGRDIRGGVIEGTFGPSHGWNYSGTNSMYGNVTPNGKFDYFASTIMFKNKFPDNTQIQQLNSSFDGILKFNYYADPKNTVTAFISNGFEQYDDYQPFFFDPTNSPGTNAVKFDPTKQAFIVTNQFQQDHDDQGYSFNYATYKHNFDPKSFFTYRIYRLKSFVTFHSENLANLYQHRQDTTVGNQFDYTNTFTPQYTLKAGVYYIESQTSYHNISSRGVQQAQDASGNTIPQTYTADWRNTAIPASGYTDRYSGVKPKEFDEYISNTLKTKDQKLTVDAGLRLAQDKFQRLVFSNFTDTYADPRLGLTYAPVKDFLIRSSFAVTSQFPDSRLVEILFPENGFTPVTARDPAAQLARLTGRYPQHTNLKTEHSQNYDFGIEKTVGLANGLFKGSYTGTASIFRRVGYDQIQIDYADYAAGAPYPFAYSNKGHSHASGLELKLEKRNVKQSDWAGFIGYTNQIARANNSDFDTGYLPYFGSYDFGDPFLTDPQFATLNNQEYSTSYDQRHTIGVVIGKRFSKLLESSAVLDAGSGFPFAGGSYALGNFGVSEGSQFSENIFNGANFNEIPITLLNNTTVQPINPVVGRSGWHYKISLNTNFYLTPRTNLFFNVDNVFDRKTVVNYATTTQAGTPYYTKPSGAYPEGRTTYGPSTILTPIFVTFGFRSKF